ncbi:MAG: TonB-dependent receptor [Bacteroidales bacterium]|nr:TonB-dependent receptor [Bacteroidales bacterium]
MRKIIIFLLLCSTITSFASNYNSEKGSIKGFVFDLDTKHPLEYATISILKLENDSIINGTITNASGYFKLKGIPAGNYKVNISFIGYKSEFIENIEIRSGNVNIDIGNINLESSAEKLQEAVVVADQSAISYKIDRKVLNTSQLDISESGTAVDVLEYYPSVNVEIDGTVSLRGSASFTVLIDNKPTMLNPSDVLNQIPANTIERIEIITNPSAKYSSEGTAGIINIISKKNRMEGFNGSIRANIGVFKNKGTDLLINVKKEKLSYYFGFNYSNRGIEGTLKNTSRSYFPDTSYTLLSEGNYDRFKRSITSRAGIDYQLNPKNLVSIQANIGDWKSGGETFLDYEEYLENGSLFSEYKSREEPTREGIFYNIDLKYNYAINDKGQKIAALVYFDRQDLVEENQNELFNLDKTITLDGNKTKESGPMDSYNFQLDYSLPLNKKHKIESGYKAEISNYDKKSELHIYNPAFTNYVFFADFSNLMEFEKSIHAAYVSYSNSLKKLGYQLGLRSEYTNREIRNIDENEINTIDRLDFFPTLHLSYNLSEKQQFMGSYSRRVQRPRNWQVEQVYTWRDAYHLSLGNSALKPQYIDSYEINFINRWKKTNSVSIDAYYRITNNSIETIKDVYSENIFVQTYENVGTSYSLGSELLLSMDLFKWWKLYVLGNFYENRLEGSWNGSDVSFESFNWSLRLYNTIIMAKSMRAQLGFSYNSPYKTVQGDNQGYYMVNASLRKEMFKDFYMTLQAQGVFGFLERDKTFKSETFYVHNNIVPNTPIINLSISYNIRNYKHSSRKEGKNPDLDNGENNL